jgi:hypothetical protein
MWIANPMDICFTSGEWVVGDDDLVAREH